jgi:hypothetical protein
MGHSLGNQNVQRIVAQVRRDRVQREDSSDSKLEQVREMLNRTFVPESQVIVLLGELNPAEKETLIADAALRKRMVKAFSGEEMIRAMTNLKPDLSVTLRMIRDAAVLTSSIDYHEIKPFISAAPKNQRLAPDTVALRNFFISVCTNETIVEAVTDLGLPLKDQLDWVAAEVTSVRASIDYNDIQSLIKKAPQEERDQLKTNRWREFFTAVTDNKTIITAVKDLNFDPLTRMEWILDEGNSGILLGGGIDPSQMYVALQDAFNGEALEFIELASLNNWQDADKKRIRQIMDSKRDDRPVHKDTLGDAAQKLAGPAGKLISKHTETTDDPEFGENSNLKEKDLAMELAGLLETNPALVRQVLDIITDSGLAHLSDKDDDVAVKTLEVVSDEVLKKVAGDPNGRSLLLTMVRKLFKGVNMGDEEKQQARVMKIISEIDAAKDEEKGATTEVEILTFLYGGKLLDMGGEALGGFRGHTAVIVGDLLYSFEAGWSCGYTKSGYLAKNTHRDGIGQVLQVTQKDAAKLQANLNKSCGTGVYFVSGDICTGQSALALDKALRRKMYEVENPQLLVGYLEATGFVKRRYSYPKKEQK